MTKVLENLQPSANFFIHFDVASHSIPIEQSIITEQALKIIVEELGKNLFGENLEIQILVFSDKEGSKLKILGIIAKYTFVGISSLCGTAFMLIESDIGKAYIKGRFGEEPAYWVEKLGKEQRESAILAEATKNFLEKDTFTLENSGISKEEFSKIYDAKNKFYKSCLDNKELKGLGFDNSENFPILPNQFPHRIAELKTKKEPKVERKIHSLKVVSAIHAKENADDCWRVKNYSGGNSENVYMKDDKFYEFYWKNDLKIHTLLAQVKYTIEEDELGNLSFKQKGKEIEKVFEYDNNNVSTLPLDYIIEPFPLVLRDVNPKNLKQEKEEKPVQESFF